MRIDALLLGLGSLVTGIGLTSAILFLFCFDLQTLSFQNASAASVSLAVLFSLLVCAPCW